MSFFANVCQDTNSPSSVLAAIESAGRLLDPSGLSVSVAYASLRGCQKLNECLSQSLSDWDSLTKRWTISVDRGVTEPDALLYLQGLSHSEVRVPSFSYLLDNRLRPLSLYHPKIYLFSGNGGSGLSAVTGSANLTFGGLMTNTEQVYIVAADRGSESHATLQSLFEWTLEDYFGAEPLSEESFLKYEKLRLVEGDLTVDLDGPAHLSINGAVEDCTFALASSMWVEVNRVTHNRGPERPGNQIDFRRGTRVFFGFPADDVPKNTLLGSITIDYEGTRIDRNMHFSDNAMDKLYLPVPDDIGLESYEESILLFVRMGPSLFRLRVYERSEIDQFVDMSNRDGRNFTLKSGRRFGLLGSSI